LARPQLKAEFFIDTSGACLAKAPPISSRLRRAIFERDGYTCRACMSRVVYFGNTASPHRPTPGAVDHIIPRARGGQNNPENLQLLCITCNSQKGAD